MFRRRKPLLMLHLRCWQPCWIQISFGRCLTGRVMQGKISVNDSVRALNLDSKVVESGRLTKLLRFEGTERVPAEEVSAG